MKILREIEDRLPWVTRVGVYANAKSIGLKSPEELAALREHGLGIAYMGLETGDDATLKAINKGVDSERMIQMGRKIRDAGVKLSITVLLGIAGRDRSEVHAKETGRVLSAIDPEYVGALSLMLIPGTPLYDDYRAERFPLLGPQEMLRELRTMIAETDMTRGLFHANHASNYLPIRGASMPEGQGKGPCELINQALAGKGQAQTRVAHAGFDDWNWQKQPRKSAIDSDCKDGNSLFSIAMERNKRKT